MFCAVHVETNIIREKGSEKTGGDVAKINFAYLSYFECKKGSGQWCSKNGGEASGHAGFVKNSRRCNFLTQHSTHSHRRSLATNRRSCQMAEPGGGDDEVGWDFEALEN